MTSLAQGLPLLIALEGWKMIFGSHFARNTSASYYRGV